MLRPRRLAAKPARRTGEGAAAVPSVQTARGPVETSELGRTLMHEHVAIRGTDVYAHWPELDDRAGCLEAAKARFAALERRGVGAVVDVTPANLGRDIALIAELQAATRVHIVAATGMYWNVPLYWQGRGPDELADAFVREIERGIGGSGIRAGIIKLASHGAFDPVNEAVLRAGARAHRRTGVPITTHAIPQELGRDQQRIFLDEGVDLARTVIGHQGNQPTLGFYRELLDAGSLLGVDNFGIERAGADWHDSQGRVGVVAALCAEGYAERIVLSHDSMCCVDWGQVRTLRAANPDWVPTYIPDAAAPALLDAGVTEAQLEAMLTANPRRLFEAQGAY